MGKKIVFEGWVLNREFRIVFQPKIESMPGLIAKRVRFAIGAGQIGKYIGEENANKAISEAIKNKSGKFTKKFRSRGTIIFYSK